MRQRSNLLFAIPLLAALVTYFVTEQLVFTAIAFVVGYLLMEALRFKLLPAHLHRAARLYQRGDLDAAMALTEKAIAENPERWESHYLQALIKFNMADLRAAEESVRKAISRKEDESANHLILGQIMFAQGLYEQAKEAFDKALHHGGKAGIHQYHAAAAAYRLGHCDETIPRMELALRLGIDNPQLVLLAKYYLADCLQKNGEKDAAQGYFDQLAQHTAELESLRHDLHIVPDFPERVALSNDVQAIASYMESETLP